MTRWIALQIGLYAGCWVTTMLLRGPVFAATLMGILTCHELGHYVAARVRGVPVSLPYFIPVPFSIGTMGAVIGIAEPIEDRDALFDVGAAGPVAGLLVAIPLLAIGLAHSSLGLSTINATLEGNSILYALMKRVIIGAWLPAGVFDVQMSPMTEAAYYGLLVTMINLLPIGQLDGGHIARAALGQVHETWSRWLHLALPAIGLAIGAGMFVTALRAGRDHFGALSYAQYGAAPWLIWTALLAILRARGGEYHPPVSPTPLGPGRRALAIGMLVVFVLIVTPVPLRPML